MKSIFQKMWPELKPYRYILLGVLALGAMVSALKAATPELLRQLPEVWKSGDEAMAIQIPLTIAGLWIVAGVCRYFHLFWMKYTSDVIAVNLRRRLMDKYLSLNLSFFQNFARGSGGLISRMLNDITVIYQGTERVADLMREPFLAAFSFIYLVVIDWKLTFFILIALPVITAIMRNLAKSLRKYGHLNQEAMEDLTKTLKESLDGTRIVQSFNLEEEMRSRFNREANHYLGTRKKIISREEAASPISEALASVTLAAILIYIGQQVFQGDLSVGDFVGFSMAIGLLQDSVKKIQNAFIKLQQASVALDRLHSILDNSETVPQSANPLPFPQGWQTIEFKNVSFSYGKKEVLRNINLTVKRGEIIALVGSSGGGKSTMINLLARFFDPIEGQIFIDGSPIHEIDLKELRHHIALVSQDVFLFGDTIERNIYAGDFSKDPKGIEPAARMANAHDFIMKNKGGYERKVGDHGSMLSGGEKQRISIARAIFKDAPILLLDEATSALDSESEREVQKGLDQLLQGRTAFVVAHRLSTIAKATRILVLKKGQIVEEGSHQELLERQGEYYKFHQLQAGV